MFSRTIINRAIILAFMFLVGISIAFSIQTRSVLGLILALTSLGAGVYFLHLLARVNQEAEAGKDA